MTLPSEERKALKTQMSRLKSIFLLHRQILEFLETEFAHWRSAAYMKHVCIHAHKQACSHLYTYCLMHTSVHRPACMSTHVYLYRTIQYACV